jgi:hypothetical protein
MYILKTLNCFKFTIFYRKFPFKTKLGPLLGSLKRTRILPTSLNEAHSSSLIISKIVIPRMVLTRIGAIKV